MRIYRRAPFEARPGRLRHAREVRSIGDQGSGATGASSRLKRRRGGAFHRVPRGDPRAGDVLSSRIEQKMVALQVEGKHCEAFHSGIGDMSSMNMMCGGS